MRRALIESVGESEVIEGNRLLAAPDELEQELALFAVRIWNGLNEEHVPRLDDELGEELLPPKDLNGGNAVLVLLEVPMQVLVVVEVAVRRARTQDAVRVALQPAPEPVELERGAGFDVDGHGWTIAGEAFLGWRGFGAALSIALAGGCASGVVELRPTRGPVYQAFAGARTVALVHERRGEPVARRDVVDGLAETLRARGWQVRPPRAESMEALTALGHRLETWSQSSLGLGAGVTDGVSAEAGAAVRAAGVDAVAYEFRFTSHRPPIAQPMFTSPTDSPELLTRSQVLGALVLVSKRDEVLRVEWGDAETVGLPQSPAEAIDALVAAILPQDEDGPSPESLEFDR